MKLSKNSFMGNFSIGPGQVSFEEERLYIATNEESRGEV